MRKLWKFSLISVIGLIVLLVLLVAAFIHNVGFNNVKQIYRLETTGQNVIRMDTGITEDHERYLTKSKQPWQLLKKRMEREGWTFIQQDGAGHFFEKNGEQIIVTSRKWNRYYEVYDLKKGLVNLAD